MHKLIIGSFEGYKKKYLKNDLLASLVVTAIAVPQSLGFAVIAGLPPVTGLYSALFAPLIFGIFASTRRLVIGADSATVTLVASGALLIAQPGSPQYINTIALLGLLTAGILLLMSLFKFGFLADFISRPVLIGFLAGVGIQLMINEIPDMLGVPGYNKMFEHGLADAGINGMTATISVLVVGMIIILRKTRFPRELVALVVAGLFAVVFQIDKLGVAMVGSFPMGLPQLVHPSISINHMVVLLPTALSIALVIMAQSSAVIRSQSNEHDEKINLNKDLLALGFANAVSALTRGFAVNGSPPRSIASEMAGGRSQLVNIFSALTIGLLLLFGGQLLDYMPSAALAGVVFAVGWQLINFSELKYIWQIHKLEFAIAIIALSSTALFGVRQGLLIAVIASLLERISRQYRPKDSVLLRDGQLSEWASERLDPHHRYESSPEGLLIYSFDGALFFDNVAYFGERLHLAVEKAEQTVHYVVVDAGAIDSIDYTAVEKLKSIYRLLGNDGIKLGFAHVSPTLMGQFERYGVVNLVGQENIFPTLKQAIKNFPGARRSSIDMIKRLELDKDSYVVIGGSVLEALGIRETHNVDVVVSQEVYTLYRDKKKWPEYVQENGKKSLSHNGYNMMRVWMSRSLKQLQRNSQVIDEVVFMGIDDLIEAKRRLGRKKDKQDIVLLHKYQRANKLVNSTHAKSLHRQTSLDRD